MKSSAIICLFLGLVTMDQADKVAAVNLIKHRSRKHRRHDMYEPQWNIQTRYESPFGLDAMHGYGGMDQKKLEAKIDLGELDSDDEQEEELDIPEAINAKSLAQKAAAQFASEQIPQHIAEITPISPIQPAQAPLSIVQVDSEKFHQRKKTQKHKHKAAKKHVSA